MNEGSKNAGRLRWALAALVTGGVCLAAVLALAGGSSDKASQPAHAAEEAGRFESNRVTLTKRAAERLGVQTAPIRTSRVSVGGKSQMRKVVPYSAVLYDEKGRTWVYTSPRALTFVRSPIKVETISGNRAILSSGPADGIHVASVGASELFGTEFEVGH